MRRVIIAGLALLTALGAVLGCSASPHKAATVGPENTATATRASATATASTNTSTSTLMLGLNGVSCVSATFCAAVGSQGDRAHLSRGDVPLTMIWDGARWRKTATPLPGGWPEGELDSVSCPSAAYCVAFGDSDRGTTSAPLAETWHGTAWTPTALPRPAGTYNRLGAVSCGAPDNCVAVASYYTKPLTAHPFVLTLSGTTWTVRQVPLPQGAAGAGFGSVSCVSAVYCVLAGRYTSYIGNHPPALFESWNGTAFTVMKIASSAASFPGGSVSCASASSCAAIGTTSKNGTFNIESVAVSWNGKVWSAVDVPGRKGIFDALYGVSCASGGNCVAAGVASTDGSEQTSHALAASYDGRSWTIASVPALAHGGTSEFKAVSCPSVNYCVAVGEGGGPGGTTFSNAALTGFWNGQGWKLVGAS
jgi:hypothetical protein